MWLKNRKVKQSVPLEVDQDQLGIIWAELPWVEIIKFAMDMLGWWKSASDANQAKIKELLAEVHSAFKSGNVRDIRRVIDRIKCL